MCGLAGIARREARGVTVETLDRMAAALRHRGPDGYGRYGGARVGLAHVRLSIIDVAGGAQPLSNEDGRLWVICNGEIYNHVELRQELQGRGHRFRTRSDTEILVHGYEEWGVPMLERLHGQFAFAIHDRQGDTVFLARDRFGVRPLFYSEQGGDVLFASEVKALFASGEVRAAPDLQGLDEVFTFWAARPPRTVFAGVQSLEPGCFAVWRDGRLRVQRYYTLAYPEAREESPRAVAELDELLHASVAERLRADVPVGGYLSGGLDSSITCALAGALTPHELRTFSVTFDDPQLDERAFQQLVARELRTDHAVQAIGPGDIAAAFPEVVRHTETPLVRTAPAPMYLLARLVRNQGIKVVLTGEGSDELFLGYDLFKETAVRLFCLRQPRSRWRPRLFERLYPYLDARGRRGDFWQRSFLDAGSPADPLFSHLPRFQLTARIKDFYSGEMRVETQGLDPLGGLRATLPAEFPSWAPLHRAAYLEMVTLLSPYLLSSQGDRMAMAHAVEGRFPFLDHRLFEFAARLPTGSKLRGLHEKDILRRWAAGVVPRPVAERPKQPYRAPDVPAFFAPELVGYARDLLDVRAVQDAGIFDPASVAGLLGRCRKGAAVGFRENQAFVAILSTQLWYQHFIDSTAPWRGAAAPEPDIAVAERASAQG